ncbi:f-box only protein 6-like protein [Holotrichia oblita]|uniref:F-box only protein 6-like protein n=1 Tax=Holotrichia oblita TaxID=644536 RepID=A0ACB9SRU4_HOLOL|nr:f-box only protein 6-like protein [Holotrichia oblita]
MLKMGNSKLPYPEEIVGEIFKKLPPHERLRSRLVCKRWNEIIIYILYNKYNKYFKTHYTPETLPVDLCYITLFSKRIRQNLLKNVNGEESFKYWKILANGGDGIVVEDLPYGSDELPDGVEEFNGNTSCFATSYGLGHKEQVIMVSKDKHLSHVINMYKPHIYVSEWVAARFDCGAKYSMVVKIVCKNKEFVEERLVHREEQWLGRAWSKKEIIIKKYPDDVEKIIFRHSAQDTQFWKGHYGMKMAGAVIKLLIDPAHTTNE